MSDNLKPRGESIAGMILIAIGSVWLALQTDWRNRGGIVEPWQSHFAGIVALAIGAFLTGHALWRKLRK